MELTELKTAYEEGRARHIKTRLVRSDQFRIECEVPSLTGNYWIDTSVRENGEVKWFASEEAAKTALESAGLIDAYNERFEKRDGVVYLNY